MPHSSTIAARCVALATSIAQVVQDVSNVARRVRHARHDLNAINTDLLIIRTALGIAQEDFSALGSKPPPALVDSVSQVLDSCDDTCECLHKAFLKLSCSLAPREDWQALRDGPLVTLRHDLNGSMLVLELTLDYITLFGQQDTTHLMAPCHVSDVITSSDELLKRTDQNETHIKLTARDRLPSLLQAIRLLRSCITAISSESLSSRSIPTRRITTPRSDSLEPSRGESRRSARSGSPQPLPISSSGTKDVGTWLAGVPFSEDASILTRSIIKIVAAERPQSGSTIRTDPTRSCTFFTDNGGSTSRTLVAPESRLRKVRSWCKDRSSESKSSRATMMKSPISNTSPTLAGSDVSVLQRKKTFDKITVSEGNRKDLNVDHRMAMDRKLNDLSANATPAEVERALCDGASAMAAHPDFIFFFIRAAYEMSPDVLRVLKDFGADITRTIPMQQFHHSAIHAAAYGHRLDTVKYLVELGHSIDTPNNAGQTPLHLAVQKTGGFEVATYLVEMGADVNHETHIGDTPLKAVLAAPLLEGKERSMLIELLRVHGAAGEIPRDSSVMRGNSKGRAVLGIA